MNVAEVDVPAVRAFGISSAGEGGMAHDSADRAAMKAARDGGAGARLRKVGLCVAVPEDAPAAPPRGGKRHSSFLFRMASSRYAAVFVQLACLGQRCVCSCERFYCNDESCGAVVLNVLAVPARYHRLVAVSQILRHFNQIILKSGSFHSLSLRLGDYRGRRNSFISPSPSARPEFGPA